jgi:hypothetical protein
MKMFNGVVYNQFAHLNGPKPKELKPKLDHQDRSAEETSPAEIGVSFRAQARNLLKQSSKTDSSFGSHAF